MDRFIVGVFNRSYAMNFNLKSNMDRFIDKREHRKYKF